MKKYILLLSCLAGMIQFLFAQGSGNNFINDLPVVSISSVSDIHFLSPEPVQYADLSSHSLIGDLPLKNILRIKIVPDSLRHMPADSADLGVLTITGESFIAQYHIVYRNIADTSARPAAIEILPAHCRPISSPGIDLTTPEMRYYSMRMLAAGKRRAVRNAKAYGLKAVLNQVYTVGDHVFLDIGYYNKTNLPYDIDEMRFKIEDKKINKATNVQSVEIKPEWQLYPLGPFKAQFHNIYVFKKVTFPENKVLNIELTEKQMSGRALTLKVRYGDLLKADTY